MEYITGETLLD